jgi:hypothetical protein
MRTSFGTEIDRKLIEHGNLFMLFIEFLVK